MKAHLLFSDIFRKSFRAHIMSLITSGVATRLYVGLNDMRRMVYPVVPAILKPEPLWSGKQVISTILLNLVRPKQGPTYVFKTSVKPDAWQTADSREWAAGGTPEARKESMTESELIMRDGHLLSGVIDKCAIG